MMYSAYRLNKWSDSRHPCCIPFSTLNQSVVPYRVPTVASCPTYRFLRRQVRCSGILISLRIFHSLLWSTQSKGFCIVNGAEVHVFVEFPCFLYAPTNVGNLISGSSAFSKSGLYIWQFLVHILLKPSLKDFEHYFASVWNECNCAAVWIFFGIGPSLGLEWKLNFFSPVATAVFSKFSGILSGALS